MDYNTIMIAMMRLYAFDKELAIRFISSILSYDEAMSFEYNASRIISSMLDDTKYCITDDLRIEDDPDYMGASLNELNIVDIITKIINSPDQG